MLLQVSLGPQFTLLLASPRNCQAPSLGVRGLTWGWLSVRGSMEMS